MGNTNTDTMGNKVEHTVTFQFPTGNILDLKARKAALDAFARLPMEDVERVSKLITNPKALAGLKKHWGMLQAMFGK